jgi:glyoxylase-like metal-dependent hydrolase (beta-lactamase superfamily II)
MFYCAAHDVLVGGDLIIGGSVGRTDLPDSNHRDLEKSIARVMKLPGNTKLLPGHGDVGTLEYELQTNPFVQDAVEGRG